MGVDSAVICPSTDIVKSAACSKSLDLSDIPQAVDRQSLDILIAFRKKTLALMCLQCFVVLVMSYTIATLPIVVERQMLQKRRNLVIDAFVCGVLWLASAASLGVVCLVRYRFPWNMVALAVFTVTMSCTLAAMSGPNVHLGVGVVLVGMMIVAVLTTIKWKDCVMQVFPVAVCVMILSNVVLLCLHFAFDVFTSPMWVFVVMFLNTVSFCWAGFQIDRLCSRLKVDEYLLSIVLLWSELLLSVLVVFSLMAISLMFCGGCGQPQVPQCIQGDVGNGCDANCTMALHNFCNCWIYSNGTHGRSSEVSSAAATATLGVAAIPIQEEMPSQQLTASNGGSVEIVVHTQQVEEPPTDECPAYVLGKGPTVMTSDASFHEPVDAI